VEYSPDLEWVAYAYWDDAHRNGMDVPAGTIVRDVITQKNLWQSTHGDEGAPAWSPDGSQVAVKDDGQLYLVNRSGQAKALLPDDIRHDVWTLTWSPDGKYLAFWNRYQESDSSLTLYQVETGKVRDYCIKNEYLGPLVWSLNSKELIVNQDIDTGAIFIDLQKNIGYTMQSGPNVEDVSAWMYSLP
jgi:Tol biopolymer transport system component